MSQIQVLVIDDDLSDIDWFRRAVERSGLPVRVDALTAGKQAIDYLEARGVYADRSLHPWPDLIVLDLKMPQVSGFDFLAWRKASTLFSSIPVLVFSGSKDPAEAKLAVKMGADKYFGKPAELEDWKGIVQEIWNIGTKTKAELTKGKAGSDTQIQVREPEAEADSAA